MKQKHHTKNQSSDRQQGGSREKAPQQNTDAVSADSTQENEGSADEFLQFRRPFAEWTALSEEIKAGILKQGYVEPTSVQQHAIGPALEGHDLVIQAKTGTGKTAAFGISVIERVEKGNKTPRALILTPTRELTSQVSRELEKLSSEKGLRIIAVYGGIKISEQIDALSQGADIVVGTPGRVMDHIRRGTFDTSKVNMLVLDEADEMLSMGFYMEVTGILNKCKNRKQLMLFSATIPPDIEGLARQYLKNPVRLMIGGKDRRVEGIKHSIYFANLELPRARNLLYILEHEGVDRAIIFCNMRSNTRMLTAYLQKQGKKALCIHGEIQQKEREEVLRKFEAGEIDLMVATDIAARGIDISGLNFVINYDFPESTDVYLHRSGRTGRQGRDGRSISLVLAKDISNLHKLKNGQGLYFDAGSLPGAKEIVYSAAQKHFEVLFKEASREVIDGYLPLADFLKEDRHGRFITAYLLKMFYEGRLGNKKKEAELIAKKEEAQPAAKKEEAQPVAVAKKEEAQPVAVAKKEEAQPAAKKEEAQPVAVAKKEEAEPVAKKEEAEPAAKKEEAQPAAKKEESEKTEAKPNTKVRLHVSVGKAEGYNSESLRQLIVDHAGVEESCLGSVQLERTHAFLYAEKENVDQILAAFEENEVDDKSIKIEVAKRRNRRRRYNNNNR